LIPTTPPSWLTVLPDGREIIDLTQPAGMAEYRRRKQQMYERQGGRCCLEGMVAACPGGMMKRGSVVTLRRDDYGGGGQCSRRGQRDDRIEVAGRWQNGVAHYWCVRLLGRRGWAGKQAAGSDHSCT
jgi:hypothetical protein